jgi:hypothetical protein
MQHTNTFVWRQNINVKVRKQETNKNVSSEDSEIVLKFTKPKMNNIFTFIKCLLYSKYITKLIYNCEAPYNLVDINVLVEPAIPVFGAEDHKQNCRRCENFSINFTLLDSSLECKIWRSLLRIFSRLLLLYCCQVQVLYTWT